MRSNIFQSAVCRTSVKYRPAPSLFYFPGLTQVHPFPNPSSFEWTRLITPELMSSIKNEFHALRASKVESDYIIGSSEHTLHQGQWLWYNYITKGNVQEKFAQQCPNTVNFLNSVPGLMAGIPFAYAFFSVLRPGSSIKAHHGPCNLRLRCHLPLIVPPEPKESDKKKYGLQCGLRVGSEVRPWREGQPLILDDTFEHEVWHNGGEAEGDRVVLLFDFWHPEIVVEEQLAIQEMFHKATTEAAPK
eukprot:c4200_g1_i1.p1 GENE.c4200_g1_i1~~c4200_g1_i1.p1  ORF type:complete len:261 (+),score=56.90 c4200_g1_i1:51-785(+)